MSGFLGHETVHTANANCALWGAAAACRTRNEVGSERVWETGLSNVLRVGSDTFRPLAAAARTCWRCGAVSGALPHQPLRGTPGWC
jgi:hypothetical protein